MGLVEAFAGLFKQKKEVVQGDILAEIRRNYPQYSGIDDVTLAKSAAKKNPEFSFLEQYDPKKIVQPNFVPAKLRDAAFYDSYPDIAKQDTMKLIDDVKLQYPAYKDIAPEKLAQAMEAKRPDLYSGIAKRISSVPNSGIAEKSANFLNSANPLETVKKIINPITGTTKRVIEIADKTGATEELGRIKGNANALENKLIDTLLTTQPNTSTGNLSDIAMMGALQLNGAYEGLTGDTLDIRPETLQAIKERKLSPEIAYASGQIVGSLALLSGVATAFRTENIASGVGKALFRNPTLARFLAPAAADATAFGASGAIKEGVRQVKEGKLDLEKFGKVVLSESAMGAGLGATNAISNGIIRTAGAAAYGFGISKVQGESDHDAAVNAAIFGLFTAASAPDVSRAQKSGVFKGARENIRMTTEEAALEKGWDTKTSKKLGEQAASNFESFVERNGGIDKINVRNYEKGQVEFRSQIKEMLAKPGDAAKSDPVNSKEIAAMKSGTEPDPVTGRKFSSTQVELPEQIAGKVMELSNSIPSKDLAPNGRELDPHVTVKFGIHGSDPEKIRQVLEDQPPIKIKLGETSIFKDSQSKSGDVVKIDVDSPDLHRLNAIIKDAVPTTDTHPIYQPHITLAYVKPGLGEKYSGDRSLKGQEISIDKISFTGKDGANVEIPLLGKSSSKMSYASKPVIAARAPTSPENAQFSVGSQAIDTFEKVKSPSLEQDKIEAKDFKLFDETRKIVQKYAKRVGEKYLPRGARGVFYPGTDNIRVNSLNNISTSAHEVTHYLDKKYQIYEKIQNVAKADIRNELSKVYLDYYPTAKVEHSEQKKIVEGIATFFQKVIEQPTEMREKFPNLYNAFFKQYGSMYHPIFTEFVTDVRRVVKRYQDLDPLKKIGSRITENFQQKEVKDSYFNFKDKFVEELIDSVYPIEKLAREAGVERTANDPSLWVRQYNNVNQMILNNLKGKHGMWVYYGGEFRKVSDQNIGGLIESLQDAGITDEFGHWLVARRQHFDFKSLDSMRDQFAQLKKMSEEIEREMNSIVARIPGKKTSLELKQKEAERIQGFVKKLESLDNSASELSKFTLGKEKERLELIQEQISKLKAELSADAFNYAVYSKDIKALTRLVEDFQKQVEEFSGVLKRDNFDRKEIDDAYSQNEERFKPFAELYDKLTQANLKMMADSDVGLLTKKQYGEFSSREGYASFKRDVYDDIIGSESQKSSGIRAGGARVSSTLSRKGSELTIINPLYSLVKDHAEIMRKSLKQVVYNKIYNITSEFPQLFQRQELKVSSDQTTGRIGYPQEKDPNILMARDSEGKRIPVLVSREIKNVIDGLLDYKNMHILERMLRTANRLFVKGTTGIYPLFAPTNFIVDQITSAAQTRTKMIPIYSALSNMSKVLFDSNSPQARFFEEYLSLGGERQTMLKWQDLGPEELFAEIKSEKQGLQKYAEAIRSGIEKGIDILGTPNQATEIATRATEYVRSRMQGNSQIVSLEDAGRVSVPFHHMGRMGGGTVGQTFLKAIPFMNPGIEALAQYYRSINGKETRNRALFVSLSVMAAMIGSATFLMENATEDQKNLYKDLDSRELAMYIWYPSSDGKRLIKIRIPEQMGSIATMVNMELANIKLDAKYSTGDIINGGAAFIPDQFDVSNPGRMFFSVLPQIIKPLIGVLTNTRDFPKTRPLVNIGLQNQEPRFQFHENTSDFAKWIGDKLNVSPIKADFLIEGYLGRTSRFITGKSISNPFMREWYFTAGRNLQDYYDIRENVRAKISSINDGKRVATESEVYKLQQQAGIIKNTEGLLKALNELKKSKETDRFEEEARNLRRTILDNIGSLRD